MFKLLNNLEEISFIKNPRDNFSKKPYEKRGNSLSMMREDFMAKKKNGNCHFVTVIHNFSTNSNHRTWNKLPNNVENALK